MSGLRRLASALRSALLFGLACLVVFVVLEGVASLVLLVLAIEPTMAMADRLHTRYDPELGWVNVPGTRLEDLYGPGASLTINGQGFRAPHDYAPQPPPGQIRVICSGDSFTLGFGVDDDETWCARLAAREPRFETVNMGQGGYGIDQSYLWFLRDGKEMAHDVHLFAFIRNDFVRARSREFVYYGKPLLSLEDDQLVVRNVPVPRAAYRVPWLYQNAKRFSELRSVQLLRPGLRFLSAKPEPEVAMPELEEIALRVFDELARLHEARGRTLVFVHLPQTDDYRQPDEPWLQRIREQSQQRGHIFVDLVQELDRLPLEEASLLYIHELPVDFPGAAGHLNATGNDWVAEHLRLHLLAIPRVQSALAPKQAP